MHGGVKNTTKRFKFQILVLDEIIIDVGFVNSSCESGSTLNYDMYL